MITKGALANFRAAKPGEFVEVDPADIPEWEKLMAGEKPKTRFCKDCASYVPVEGWVGKCMRTNVSLVDGREHPIDQAATDQRYHEGPGYCGESGQFWRPKTVTMTNAAGEKLEVPAEMFEPDRVMDRKPHVSEDDGA